MPKRDKAAYAARMRSRSVVARRIEELRTSRGLTRSELGKLVNLPRIKVWRIETGATPIDAEAVLAFAEALGVPAGSLYRESRAA